MKKILSLLSNILLIIVTVFEIISCKNKEKNNQYKSENGDSIWAEIFNNKKITSSDIWNILEDPFINIGNGKWINNPNHWDGNTRIKISIQLIKILSIAILSNPDKFFLKENKTTINNIADYKDLIDILKKQWQLLIISTNNTIEKKKQSFKENDKKNWEKKYHNFLDSNYKDINNTKGNKKYEIEEQNYKADIMTSGIDGGISGSQILTNILLNNNMRVYKQNTAISSLELLQNFSIFLKSGNKLENWNNNNQNLRTQLALAFTWDKNKNIFCQNINDLTIYEINNRLNKINNDLKKYDYNHLKYINNNHLPVSTPVFENSSKTTIGFPLLSETYDIGQLSLFQKYIIEKWFKNEKPLAISKITYDFKPGISHIENGFIKDNFDEITKIKINKDLKTLIFSKNWEEFVNNSEGVFFSSPDLLTLSTQADSVKSNILKSSIYNSININNKNSPSNIDDLINKINRKNNSYLISANFKIGNNDNDNIVAFFDTNGLNFVHIDGQEYLKNIESISYNKYDINWQFKSLNYSNNTYSLMDDKSNIMTSKQNKQMINTQFSNIPYLWYLINRSLINNNSNSKLKFNVLDEVKKYAILNTDSDLIDDKTWWFWIYDFFNNFNNKILKNKKDNQEWLKRFIIFKDGQGKNNNDWFISIINAMSSNLTGGALQRLYNYFETENKIIEEYKIDGPSAKINTKNIIDKISKIKIWNEEISKDNEKNK